MPMNDRAINDQFRQLLGRDAHPDEIQVFNEFMKENDLQPYEIGQIIQSHPEYQQNLLTQQGGQYADLLGKSDERILGLAQDQARGDFARMGRASSSGYTAAFANAARDLAMGRQQQLAQFYGQGYGGIRNLAAGQGQNALQRGYGLRDERRQRGWAIDDYYRQQNDFNSALKGQSRRNLQGSLTEAGIKLGTGLISGGLSMGLSGMTPGAGGGPGGFSGLGGSGSGAGLGYNPSLYGSYNSMPGYYSGYMRR